MSVIWPLPVQYSHSDGLFPFGAGGVGALLGLLGLAIHRHLNVGTWPKPVLLVLLQFRREDCRRASKRANVNTSSGIADNISLLGRCHKT